MKKYISIVLIIVICFVSFFAFSACRDKDETCTVKFYLPYEEESEKEASCISIEREIGGYVNLTTFKSALDNLSAGMDDMGVYSMEYVALYVNKEKTILYDECKPLTGDISLYVLVHEINYSDPSYSRYY